MCARPAAKNSVQRAELLQDLSETFASFLTKELDLEPQAAVATADQLVAVLRKCWKGQNMYVAADSRLEFNGETVTMRGEIERTGGRARGAIRRGKLFQALYTEFIAFLFKDFTPEREHAIEVAQRLMSRLREAWGGQNLYISGEMQFNNIARDWQIYERSLLGNAGDLALEYGLSYVRVYQIIRRCAAEVRARARANAPAHAVATFSATRPAVEPTPLAESIGHVDRKTFISK